jgi:hypothetical protein
MITRFLEQFVLLVWNFVRGRFTTPLSRKIQSREALPASSVSLGTVLRSPFAPGNDEHPAELRLTLEEKRRQLYLLGSTGSGKTNLLLQLVRNDIEHARGVFLLDFRGELVDRVLMILASRYTPEELRDRLILIDLRRDDFSVPFNPLREDAVDAYARTRFIMEVIRSQWDIGVQTEQLLRNSLLALSGKWSMYELEVLLTNPTFRAQVLDTVTDTTVRRFFERFDRMGNPSAWIEPVLNKISPWLARPVLRNMLAQLDTISFHHLLDRRPDSIVLVSLSADTLFGDAHLIGSLITSALASAAMRPERRDRRGNEVCLYVDEFEHFDGLGEQFSAILSEGRKFGLCACLSHQTTIQLNPKLRNLIRNVVATQIFFAVGGGEADTLAGEIASDEPKAVTRHALMNQRVGECTVVRRGHPHCRIRTAHVPDPDVDLGKVEELRLSAMRAFGRPQAEIEAELAERDTGTAWAGGPTQSNSSRNASQNVKPHVHAPAPAENSENDGDTTYQTVLEVREDDTQKTERPARAVRRKKPAQP